MKFKLFTILLIMSLFSCVERGKPLKTNKQEKTSKENKTNKLAHYTCPNGHSGADVQGKCSECQETLVHNQAYHGLNIPKDGIKDPFNNANQTAATPAQNQYGDFHYTCPNGHSGGSGTNENCKVCDTQLTHNQLYHK